MLIHQLKYYDAEDEEIVSNYRLWHENVKDGNFYKYLIHFYYLRKILFAIIIVSTISTTPNIQTIMLITLSSIMLIGLIILRPYQDNLRNIIHILNEIGLTFIGGAMLFYQNYI